MASGSHRIRNVVIAVLASAPALGLIDQASAQCCAPRLGGSGKNETAQCAAGSCVVLNISGMTCQGCAPRLETALGRVKGVKSVMVSYQQSEAIVELDKPAPKPKQLIKAVRKAGFDARVKAVSASAAGSATQAAATVQ